VAPFDDPDLRRALLAAHARNELVIDVTSRDRVREAGFSASDTYLARGTIDFFQQFIAEHRDELDALRLIYNQPYGARGSPTPRSKSWRGRWRRRRMAGRPRRCGGPTRASRRTGCAGPAPSAC